MNKSKSSARKKIWLALAGVLVLVMAALFWLYSGSLTQAKINIFRAIPLPLARVGGQSIPVKEFLTRYDFAKRTLGDQQTDEQSKNAIYQELVYEAKVEQLAGKYGLSVAQKDIDDAYSLQAKGANAQGYTDFSSLLNSYGLSESYYKNNVIRPGLLINNLRTWFNSQASQSPAAYQVAGSIVQKIKDGGNMADLAKQYSEDNTGKQIGGDLGFVDPLNLAAELREPVFGMAVGDVKIIPSRYGLHILKLEDKKDNLLHLREIFLTASDFKTWFDSQTSGLNPQLYLKI